MGRSRRDSLTPDMFPDMFEVPFPAEPLEAAYDYRAVVSGLVSKMLSEADQAGFDRYKVAAEMSRLKGHEVSKYMLDAYSSVSRAEFNLPFYLVPALETACSSHLLSAWLADVRGGRLLIGKDALNAELGRLERVRDEAGKTIKQLKRQLGEDS